MPETQLLERASRLLRRKGEPFCVAMVVDGVAATAVRGMDPEADVEIGSVSKGITGLLLHDAIGRGEVSLQTPLGELLDVGDAVGAVTLGRLATHTSGLPRLAPGSGALRKTWRLLSHGENPYGESLFELLSLVRDVRPQGSKASYSNLGFMLLGHALASAAGMPYASLARSRLFSPVGMAGAYVPDAPVDLSGVAAAGHNRLGRVVEPWTGEALGPAGGVRASVADLALLLAALLDGTAPGVSALDPVQPFSGRAVRIGAGWITLEDKGRDVTWHNGGTGGFRSFVGVDRVAGRGVAVVRASPRSADGVGFGLLRGD